MNADLLKSLREREIAGVLAFENGHGDLPRAVVTTRWGRGEIYLHGAQVTGFAKKGEPPLLFLSQFSRFAAEKAIRGGVPICFPWFGPREGDVAHGYARIVDWEFLEATAVPEGGATLRFRLPRSVARPAWAALEAIFVVVLTDKLTMELVVTNKSQGEAVEFENCLHTYFAVGDIAEVLVSGLESAAFIDHLGQHAVRPAAGEPIRITAQTDCTYLDSTGAVEIRDGRLRRTVRIEKSGSASTVVWNPWKTARDGETRPTLPDFGPEEHRGMICVESGNIGRNRVTLLPGATSILRVSLSSSAE